MNQSLMVKTATRILLVVVLVVACWAMTVHLGKPLLGPHAFRQTQTAISAYYMAEDTWMFSDYITPVLGKPWQIPMELPIYQWCVARWHNMTGMGLDASGKLVSVFAWLACIAPAWTLLRSLQLAGPQTMLSLVVMFSSPLYLFWSNAFLIESTGVFFATSMVACVVHGHAEKDTRWLVAGFLFGVLAILCKATTWAPAAGVGMLLLFFRSGWPDWRSQGHASNGESASIRFRQRDVAVMVAAVCCLVLPIIPGKLWLSHGDSVKAANPFAREFLLANSRSIEKWTYGTWDQKLDPATWQIIWRHVTDQLLVPLPLIGPYLFVLVLVLGVVAAPKRIPLLIAFLVGFAGGPLVFTNLYFEHSYYWMANGIWLLLAVGTAIAGISECRPGKLWPQVTAVALATLIAIAGFTVWFQRFAPILRSLPTREQVAESWARPIQAIVPQERTILVVGESWNPFPLYYAERRGIAFSLSDNFALPGPQLEESLRLLAPQERLGAVVVAEKLMTTQNEPAVARVLDQLKMSKTGTRLPFGVVFSAEDLATRVAEPPSE